MKYVKFFGFISLFVCLLVGSTSLEARRHHRSKVSISSFSLNLGLGALFVPQPEKEVVKEVVYVQQPQYVVQERVIVQPYPVPYTETHIIHSAPAYSTYYYFY